MSDKPFEVKAGAWLQFEHLTRIEKSELEQLLSGEPSPSAMTRRTDKGHFVSRLGPDKRVLWQRSDHGRPIVLSIVDRTYRVSA